MASDSEEIESGYEANVSDLEEIESGSCANASGSKEIASGGEANASGSEAMTANMRKLKKAVHCFLFRKVYFAAKHK